MSNENKLPEYFAIKRDSSNPLWYKYILWLQAAYNDTIRTNHDWLYYGYDGEVNASYGLNLFNNTVIELTLEQWDEIVNGKKDINSESLQDMQYKLEAEITLLNSILSRMFLAIANSPENKLLAEKHVELNRIKKQIECIQ